MRLLLLCVLWLCSEADVLPGDQVCVSLTNGEGLRVHAAPSVSAGVVCTALPSDAFTVVAGPTLADNYTWWQLGNPYCAGWAVQPFLMPCGGNATRWNRFGLGLVSEGTAAEWSYVSNLAGAGGWILLIFAGIDLDTTAPQQSWIDAVNAVYAAGLNPVVRLGPPWGGAFYRDMSDDAAHMSYKNLSRAFAAVVAALPRPSGSRLWLQIDNEVDLCYEWACGTNEGGARPFAQTASEYAHMLIDVVAAVRALGDDFVLVGAAPLAPGGCVACGCCGAENCPADAGGITGLQFMSAMMAAVPGVFNQVDFLATHSYPASGIGYGFNAPLADALPGLTYYQLELRTINRSVAVLVTETGWATSAPGLPACTEADKAAWTTGAYAQVWLNDTRVVGVMPFMLMDPTWGDTDGWEYVTMNGALAPVFSAVQSLRQQYFP